LHIAAREGHKEIVELLLAKGVDVNAKDKEGKTPLDAAIYGKNPQTADLLRKHGGKSGAEISIQAAVAVGNIEAVKQHLAAGSDVNAKNSDDWTPLQIAADKGHKEIAELLIDKGADVNAKNDRGGTPLHYAASGVSPSSSAQSGGGHKEVVELLIAAGAEVNAKNDGGWTPLHWAAQEGQKEIAELLIAKGADVNAKDVTGRTPLDSAIFRNHPETANLLRKHGGKTGEELKAADKPTVPVAEAAQLEPPTAKAPDISIYFAAESGNIEAVKQHLDAGTDVNVGRLGGITPLHYAAYHGHKEVAELLIAKGADVNAKDVTGRTPLDSAIFRNHPETANLLRKHGGKRGRR
jgi:cytohesin